MMRGSHLWMLLLREQLGMRVCQICTPHLYPTNLQHLTCQAKDGDASQKVLAFANTQGE